jgi:prepilin-type N-terminal cleavage/methylation domain-containing protein
VKIRPSNHNSQGYTLVEMLVVLIVTGFVMSIAVPSLMALNKPLRDGTLQFKSQLSLIRSKAISSNQAYRIRPRYPTTDQVIAEHPNRAYPQAANNFIVEYAANCQVSRYGHGLSSANPSTDPNRPYNATYPNGAPDGWKAASNLDLDLPVSIGVFSAQITLSDGSIPSTTSRIFLPANDPNNTTGTTVASDATLGWSICYDNRGVAYQTANLMLKDFQANNQAKYAGINVGIVGSAEIDTYDQSNVLIPKTGQGNPVF